MEGKTEIKANISVFRFIFRTSKQLLKKIQKSAIEQKKWESKETTFFAFLI